VADCGKSTEVVLDRQAIDGYRTREDAQAAAQEHIRTLVADKSRSLCRGKCEAETSRCKAIVLDHDLVEAVRTFMHRDDDGDSSFGWLIEGTVTVQCACVEKRRPDKPVPPVPSTPAGTARSTARRRARKTTAPRQSEQRRPRS